MVISTMWERVVGVKDVIVVGILIMRPIKWFLNTHTHTHTKTKSSLLVLNCNTNFYSLGRE